MRTQTKQYDDDDGRVICDMDVEGMPWHDRRVRKEARQARQAARASHPSPIGDKMTRSEARRYTFYAMLAGLVIVLIFGVVWAIVTLFMTQIWFR